MAATENSDSAVLGPPTVRHLVVALSLSNLIFFPVWQTALHFPNEYYYDTPTAGREIVAAALNVALLTMLFWGASRIAVRRDVSALRRGARCAFLATLLIPLNHVRTNLGGPDGGSLTDVAGKAVLGLGALFVLVGIYFTLAGSKKASLAAQVATLIFLPYAALTFGQGVWVLVGGRDALFREGELAESLAAGLAPDRPRVLWLIFDQLDQELAFDARPADVPLPALDRLRDEAFSADHSYAPAGWTIVSIPALLTGRFVERAKPASANSLWLTFHDQEEPERWGSQPSVFSQARARQLNTALVGNYHPYCRILSADLVSCYSVSYTQGVPDPCGSLVCKATSQVVGLVYRLPLMDRVPWIRSRYEAMIRPLPWEETRAGIERFQGIHARALALAADPDMDLVFIHYPVPHGPIVFSRKTNEFLKSGEAADRFDNMVLADRALAALRAAIEQAGLWDRTAILVSADHGEKDIPAFAFDTEGRRVDRRVPFIVKLPHQNVAAYHDRELNTVITQDIVLGILDGAISTEADLSTWLKEKSRTGRSPVFPGNEN